MLFRRQSNLEYGSTPPLQGQVESIGDCSFAYLAINKTAIIWDRTALDIL
jgi:hypothetical protein